MALALALKYRPITFHDLVAQESVTKTLSLALQNNRIAHAYLFSGLRGSGKTTSARILARALQCEKAPIGDPCNTCENCLQSLEGRHLDIIEMDAASSRKIDDIRGLIEQTRYAPSYGKYKIFIIDEVHMLTKEAFNALLKTLEEPPSYVKFILATTDPLKLPATILSRTQHFRFRKIPQKHVIRHLCQILEKENITYENEAIEIIARSGNGSLRDTLTLTDQAISYCNQNLTRNKVAEMLGAIDPAVLNNFFQAIASNNQEELQHILEVFEEYEAEMILDEMMLFLKELFKGINEKNTLLAIPMLTLDRYLQIIAQAKNLLNLNCDGGFVLLLTSLKMQEAQKYTLINQEIKQLETNLQQKTINTAPLNTSNIQASQQSQNTSLSLFNQLIKKIYDRNITLGEIFEKNITFISFENQTLTWESKASSEAKDLLKENYATIKNFAQEIFGIETKILSQNATNTTPQIQQTSLPQDLESNNHNNQQQTDHKTLDFYTRNQNTIQNMQQYLPIKEVKRVKNV
ncbi:DNA polymerase III subunit gamma/tau [Helicobacter anseris]|uniref:DNA polymerase III subunit gamma/tau n=1 Tax=Helicobacter anseris TaxID=375926 RepID=A0A3D8J749_9HELI|nr:DNA polymerase III subunit gamma/tau [Helicobacter anseris]RDU73252.1 DNA polymerase III subunit gamma/tau [Helicobacter anseris]